MQMELQLPNIILQRHAVVRRRVWPVMISQSLVNRAPGSRLPRVRRVLRREGSDGSLCLAAALLHGAVRRRVLACLHQVPVGRSTLRPPVVRQGSGHGGGGGLGRTRRRLRLAVLGFVVPGRSLPPGHYPSRLLHLFFQTCHGSRHRHE
uniref:Uncharacterized protein n=1 Tax=Arundo donax TaxID=35708 RepID=A0A0A9EA44_ARUDO